MTNGPMLTLYDLLPAIYRIDDEKAGGPLAAFLSVVQEQADRLKTNIDQLYADLFIETCDEWVIPYIGDLVGNRPLYEVLRTRRADVARTLYYRRRKGTLPALEELARDVTGWSVRVVPFFESLVWTQHANHRRDRGTCASIRSLQTTDLFGGPFEQTAHTLDIRELGQKTGWYHPKRAGFFSWRIGNYHIEGGIARREAAPNAHGFHFSPSGLPTRLFQRPEDLEPGVLTEERHVRQPIRAAAFFADPSRFYDSTVTPSVHRRDGAAFSAPVTVAAMDLSAFAQPASGIVGVDPLRGLISFAAGEVPAQAAVSYRGAKPEEAERLPQPNDHVFRFPLLNLDIRHDGALVPVGNLQYMDLSAWAQPAAGRVGVDLGLGRVSFRVGEQPNTDVEYRFGSEAFVIAPQADAPNAHGFLLELPANTASLRISRDGAPIPAFQLFCMRLNTWNRPAALRVGVDLELGRISFPTGEEPSGAVVVSYDYGFSADLGGGPYDRLLPSTPGEAVDTDAAKALGGVISFHNDPAALDLHVGLKGFVRIDDALQVWRNAGRPNCTVTIQDNRTYTENLNLDLGSKALVVQAANGCRPAIVGDATTSGGNGTSALLLSGLWMLGPLSAEGDLQKLTISHCTIAPEAAHAVQLAHGAGQNRSTTIGVERSVVGAVSVPPDSSLTIHDSITGALAAGGVSTIERTTTFGVATLHEITLISESIFTGAVNVARRQSGCVRYSSLPSSSLTPRRYSCQPDLALENVPDAAKPAAEIKVTPVFTSKAFNHFGFAQLSAAGPRQISAGGVDGGEMGAFQFLQQGRREANLRLRLDEYLPFGLRAGIIYVS
jgi:hypothetical protein